MCILYKRYISKHIPFTNQVFPSKYPCICKRVRVPIINCVFPSVYACPLQTMRVRVPFANHFHACTHTLYKPCVYMYPLQTMYFHACTYPLQTMRVHVPFTNHVFPCVYTYPLQCIYPLQTQMCTLAFTDHVFPIIYPLQTMHFQAHTLYRPMVVSTIKTYDLCALRNSLK